MFLNIVKIQLKSKVIRSNWLKLYESLNKPLFCYCVITISYDKKKVKIFRVKNVYYVKKNKKIKK